MPVFLQLGAGMVEFNMDLSERVAREAKGLSPIYGVQFGARSASIFSSRT
jgi:hypothetical protein